jgi:hypothetical protein
MPDPQMKKSAGENHHRLLFIRKLIKKIDLFFHLRRFFRAAFIDIG